MGRCIISPPCGVQGAMLLEALAISSISGFQIVFHASFGDIIFSIFRSLFACGRFTWWHRLLTTTHWSMLINQFVPPTFCFCFACTAINFRGTLHHVCDMACDENLYGPIRTCKCRSPNWLINYMLNGNTKCQVMWTYHKFFSKPRAHAFSCQFKCCWS